MYIRQCYYFGRKFALNYYYLKRSITICHTLQQTAKIRLISALSISNRFLCGKIVRHAPPFIKKSEINGKDRKVTTVMKYAEFPRTWNDYFDLIN